MAFESMDRALFQSFQMCDGPQGAAKDGANKRDLGGFVINLRSLFLPFKLAPTSASPDFTQWHHRVQVLDFSASDSADAWSAPPPKPTSTCSSQAQATTILHLDYSSGIHTGLPVSSALVPRGAHSAHCSQRHLLYIKANQIFPYFKPKASTVRGKSKGLPVICWPGKISLYLFSAPSPDTVLCTPGSSYYILSVP